MIQVLEIPFALKIMRNNYFFIISKNVKASSICVMFHNCTELLSVIFYGKRERERKKERERERERASERERERETEISVNKKRKKQES